MKDSLANEHNLFQDSISKHSRNSSDLIFNKHLINNEIEDIVLNKETLQNELRKYGKQLNDRLTLDEIAELVDKLNNV